MAVPITSIKKKELTPEEIKQNKLEELQSLIAEQDQALNKILRNHWRVGWCRSLRCAEGNGESKG